MKKADISYNKKQNIMRIILKLNNLEYLTNVLTLLDSDTMTSVTQFVKKPVQLTMRKDKDILNTIMRCNADSDVVSLLFLDGEMSDYETDCEVGYLARNLIRFFIAVEYTENEIYILINTTSYDKIFEKIKLLAATG